MQGAACDVAPSLAEGWIRARREVRAAFGHRKCVSVIGADKQPTAKFMARSGFNVWMTDSHNFKKDCANRRCFALWATGAAEVGTAIAARGVGWVIHEAIRRV